MRRRALVAVAALGVGGCLLPPAWRPPPRLPACPGALVSTERVPGDFDARQRYRARRGDLEVTLLLAVEKRGAVLTLAALDPFGATAFTLRQEGLAVEVASDLGRALAVPPENVLRDLHRVRFLRGVGPEPPPHGRVVVEAGPDRVVLQNSTCATESTIVSLLQTERS